MSVSFICSLLGISKNVADAVELSEFVKRFQSIEDLYVSSFIEAFGEVIKNVHEDAYIGDPELDRTNFKHRLNLVGLFPKLSTQTLTTKSLNQSFSSLVSNILSDASVVCGGEINDQIKSIIIETAHSKFLKKIIDSHPELALNSLLKTTENIGELLNVITSILSYVSEQANYDKPLPSVYIPSIPYLYQEPTLILDNSIPKFPNQINSIEELINLDSNVIAVTGESGIGKTTYLNSIAYHILLNLRTRYCVMISMVNYSKDIISTIKSVMGWNNVPDNGVLEELGKRNSFILLDGLNEVSKDSIDKLLSEINLIFKDFKGKIILSYNSTYSNYFNLDFPEYEIQTLNPNQVEKIIDIYFTNSNEPNKTEWFISKVTEGKPLKDSSFYQLVKVPMHLLYFLDIESDYKENLTFTSLTRLFLEKRLERNSQRGKSIPLPLIIKCLSDLAFTCIKFDHSIHFTKSFALDIFSKYVPITESVKLLTDCINSSLLIECDINFVEWLHSSLCDYLVGLYLYEIVEKDSPFEDLNLGDNKWANAIAFGCGVATMAGNDINLRSSLFIYFLNCKPSIQNIQTIVKEFQISNNCLDEITIDNITKEVNKVKWADRFLISWNSYLDAISKESYKYIISVEKYHGLNFYFSSATDYTFIILTTDFEVKFEQIGKLDEDLSYRLSLDQKIIGFGLHSNMLTLIDPEVISYLCVGYLLFINSSHKEVPKWSDKWFEDISSYSLITPAEWDNWSDSKLVENRQDLQGFKKEGGVLLNYHDFYMPLYFQIGPKLMPVYNHIHSKTKDDNLCPLQLMTCIWLGLTMPINIKSMSMDIPKFSYIPFESKILNRYYRIIFQLYGTRERYINYILSILQGYIVYNT